VEEPIRHARQAGKPKEKEKEKETSNNIQRNLSCEFLPDSSSYGDCVLQTLSGA